MDRPPVRDRALVNNPNYPPQPSASPYPLGPAIQQPRFDPFQKRDPFLPNPAADRRDGPPTGSSSWSNYGPNSAGIYILEAIYAVRLEVCHQLMFVS